MHDHLSELLTLSVVSHGHGPLLLRLMHELDDCTEVAGATVVVTLNLRDEPFDASAFPALHVVVMRNEQPRGFGANHNTAFKHCATPWFVILNPDLRIVDPHCFFTLLQVARSMSRAALLAPVVRNLAGQEEDAVRVNLSLPSLWRRRCGESTSLDARLPAVRGQRFYWLAGMFLFADAGVFREMAGFDERYFLYCEDYDLSARIFNAGHALVQVREAEVLHDAQRDSHRSLRHLKLHVVSLLKVWLSAAFWRVYWHDLMLRRR